MERDVVFFLFCLMNAARWRVQLTLGNNVSQASDWSVFVFILYWPVVTRQQVLDKRTVVDERGTKSEASVAAGPTDSLVRNSSWFISAESISSSGI